jgi:very-short-patch-repair endonuclease
VSKADASRNEFFEREGYRVAHVSNGIVLKAPGEFVKKVKDLCERLQLKKVKKVVNAS